MLFGIGLVGGEGGTPDSSLMCLVELEAVGSVEELPLEAWLWRVKSLDGERCGTEQKNANPIYVDLVWLVISVLEDPIATSQQLDLRFQTFSYTNLHTSRKWLYILLNLVSALKPTSFLPPTNPSHYFTWYPSLTRSSQALHPIFPWTVYSQMQRIDEILTSSPQAVSNNPANRWKFITWK